LYRIFFKTYTEKVWGVPATSIQADWAAQRIKNLSLFNAVITAILPARNQKKITSLIEEFQYPKFGPGMMWEACTTQLISTGIEVRLQTRVTKIDWDSDSPSLGIHTKPGEPIIECRNLVTSLPINELVQIMNPSPPPDVLLAASNLKHRDFLTVAIVVSEEFSFPDNWIYIHSPEVRVGRVQNYGSWSPFLIKDGKTCLGLEYFVSQGDDLWEMDDESLVKLATAELEVLKLIDHGFAETGFVVRVPKAYPVYDKNYQENVQTIRDFLSEKCPQIHPVGRNGMHRYNNQDHSMMTAMLTAENIALGTSHDIWSVNVEEDYHETASAENQSGTGRAAPVT
jgi:protoporphyrinogen oxidase